jgi:hypothetical protein
MSTTFAISFFWEGEFFLPTLGASTCGHLQFRGPGCSWSLLVAYINDSGGQILAALVQPSKTWYYPLSTDRLAHRPLGGRTVTFCKRPVGRQGGG